MERKDSFFTSLLFLEGFFVFCYYCRCYFPVIVVVLFAVCCCCSFANLFFVVVVVELFWFFWFCLLFFAWLPLIKTALLWCQNTLSNDPQSNSGNTIKVGVQGERGSEGTCPSPPLTSWIFFNPLPPPPPPPYQSRCSMTKLFPIICYYIPWTFGNHNVNLLKLNNTLCIVLAKSAKRF